MERARLGRTDRLHAKGYISDPKSQIGVVSTEGVQRSRHLLEEHFARKESHRR